MARPATNGFEEVSPYRWWILVGLITAAILEVLDTTIVNVSLPQMAGNLGATTEEIGWVSTGYILSNVVVLPMTAWLSSRFGRRRYLSGSILLFTAASFFCGISNSLQALVVWRILQGAGGAALLATAQATIREVFPKSQQGLVQAIYVLGIIVAPTLGPTLGGWITDNYSWHWAFLINIPIGIASFLLVSTFLQDSAYAMKTTKIDWLGVALLTVGLGSLQYVLEEGNAKLWLEDPTIAKLSFLAAVSLPLFVWWQLTPRNPMPVVNLRVLRNKDLTAALVLFLVLGFGLYGGVFLFPMFAQGVLRLTPTTTGLALLPGGIATGVSAILTGRLANPAKILVDPRILIFTGLAMFTGAMVMMGGLPSNSDVNATFVPLLLRGFGLGLLFVPINLAAFASLEGSEIAQGSGLMNLCRQLGGSFGIAVLGSYVTHQMAMARGNLVGHVATGSPGLAERLQGLTQNFVAHGYPLQTAQQAAMAVVDRQLQVQASTVAFNASFIMIAGAALLASPLVFILRKPKGFAGTSAAAAEAH
ncbi:MAG: DHA2 family efflux MFS transporter permease subunit [Armatimonadetes bacterium]|nr:DHA2 family efflux MFS transporter permease subunit [Armatimonadota bacterium]